MKMFYENSGWTSFRGRTMTLFRLTKTAYGVRFRRFSTETKLQWPSNRVRRTFVDYFSSLGYTFVQSSSIVPYDDHSLLYVNAGMNQFKPIFLGTLNPAAKRAQLRLAVNSQKCVRAGWDKDLEQVGRDGYHHTFFGKARDFRRRVRYSKRMICFQKCWAVGRSPDTRRKRKSVSKRCDF